MRWLTIVFVLVVVLLVVIVALVVLVIVIVIVVIIVSALPPRSSSVNAIIRSISCSAVIVGGIAWLGSARWRLTF